MLQKATAIAGLVVLWMWTDEDKNQRNQQDLWSRRILFLWVLFRWVLLIDHVCAFELFGPRILPILSSVRDTVPFFVVMVLAFSAVFHAYFVLGTGGSMYNSLLTTFRLGQMADAGGLDESDMAWGEGSGESIEPAAWLTELKTETRIWFFLVVLIMTIMMMNILIGILGSNYDRLGKPI